MTQPGQTGGPYIEWVKLLLWTSGYRAFVESGFVEMRRYNIANR